MSRSRFPRRPAVLVALVTFVLLLVSLALILVAGASPPAQASWALEGRVYEGNVGDQSSPVQGVTVGLYGSNNAGVQGSHLRSTTTNSGGWYGLTVYDTDNAEYFHIVQTNLVELGYTSVGATTVSGTVRSSNWI